jgi:hypothetical protein
LQLYDKERELVMSVKENDETYCVAGNQLGKDFMSGFIALSFFIAPHIYFPDEYVRMINAQRTEYNTFPQTRRVITTSVKDRHINVLWGEIGRFVQTSRLPLLHTKGGPLVVNVHEIRFKWELESKNPLNYLVGQVSETGEGLSGHHAAYTLLIGDEASGLEDKVHEAAQGWAKKFLYIGNPNPCSNFFYKAVEAGDLLAENKL